MSGHQYAGCCVHVAAVIYYLSYVKEKIEKEPRSQKYPATHLNSIIVKVDKDDKPNEPRYVKHKRRSSCFISKDFESSSSSEFSSVLSDDDLYLTKVKNVSKKALKKPYLNVKKNSLLTTESHHELLSTTNIETEEDTSKEFEKSLIPIFEAHIPTWGGNFIKDGKQIRVINTCTIDNYLFSLWVMSKIIPLFSNKSQHLESSNSIMEIINFMHNYELLQAKETFFNQHFENYF